MGGNHLYPLTVPHGKKHPSPPKNRGQPRLPETRAGRSCPCTHGAVGEGIAIRVGDDLEEDVHAVQDGGDGGVPAVFLGDLRGEESRSCLGAPQGGVKEGPGVRIGVPGHMVTLLAVQTPVACVIHSREWMPVSSQMAGRFDPPVLNCTERGGFQPRALPGLGKVRVSPVPTFSTYKGLFS